VTYLSLFALAYYAISHHCSRAGLRLSDIPPAE
jgi:hypothetical protein